MICPQASRLIAEETANTELRGAMRRNEGTEKKPVGPKQPQPAAERLRVAVQQVCAAWQPA